MRVSSACAALCPPETTSCLALPADGAANVEVVLCVCVCVCACVQWRTLPECWSRCRLLCMLLSVTTRVTGSLGAATARQHMWHLLQLALCVSMSRVLHGRRTEQRAVAVANSVKVHF